MNTSEFDFLNLSTRLGKYITCGHDFNSGKYIARCDRNENEINIRGTGYIFIGNRFQNATNKDDYLSPVVL